MKLILRFLLYLHVALLVYGVSSMLINKEFIKSSKFIFIGFTGVLVFWNTLLQFPIRMKFQNVLLGLGALLYLFTASGFLFPSIFKNYWNVLFGTAIFLFLMSLFVYSAKHIFQNKLDYLFLSGCFFASIPIVFYIKNTKVLLLEGIVLGILTVVILVRLFRYQSK